MEGRSKVGSLDFLKTRKVFLWLGKIQKVVHHKWILHIMGAPHETTMNTKG